MEGNALPQVIRQINRFHALDSNGFSPLGSLQTLDSTVNAAEDRLDLLGLAAQVSKFNLFLSYMANRPSPVAMPLHRLGSHGQAMERVPRQMRSLPRGHGCGGAWMMGPYLESIRSRVGSQCILLPGVRAIILNDLGEVLLQRRTDLKCWGLPSGSVELDETGLEALKREVREETSLEVRHAEPMALYSGPNQRFQYPNGDEIQCFSVAFIVRDWAGEPKADGVEGSEVRFWPMDALPKNLLAIHARTLADFRQYHGGFMLPGEPEMERNS